MAVLGVAGGGSHGVVAVQLVAQDVGGGEVDLGEVSVETNKAVNVSVNEVVHKVLPEGVQIDDAEEVKVRSHVIGGLTLISSPDEVGDDSHGASNERHEKTSNLPGNDLLESHDSQITVEGLEDLPEHARLGVGAEGHKRDKELLNHF